MKLFLPKQHGAWAMLIIPFWLGVIATEFIWQHIPFFFGWLFLYLATYPMLLLFKKKKISYYFKWTIIYLIPALLLLLIPLLYQPKLIYFGIGMIPFFLINAFYSSKNRDRAFGNDLSAIAAFTLAGLGSGFIVIEQINSDLILVMSSCFLFFMGSTFYVKTMIREKKNETFKWISWGYHVAILVLWVILAKPLVVLALFPSLVRAVKLYGKSLSPKKIGIYEIVNSAIFFVVIFVHFHLTML